MRAFVARVGGREGADDVAQETFLKAWRMAASYRGEGSYRAWLLRIAWNQYVGGRRKRREQSGADDLPERGYTPRADEAIDTARALAALDPRERAAALLCFGYGHSHGEAAEILDMPLGTLKSIVARARARLVDHLGESA